MNYDNTNWKLIADYMDSDNYDKIHVRNRVQLINDLSYMAASNRQNYTTFLNLAKYLVREVDYPPWLPTFRAVRNLRYVMYDEDVDEALKVNQILTIVLKHLQTRYLNKKYKHCASYFHAEILSTTHGKCN